MPQSILSNNKTDVSLLRASGVNVSSKSSNSRLERREMLRQHARALKAQNPKPNKPTKGFK